MSAARYEDAKVKLGGAVKQLLEERDRLRAAVQEANDHAAELTEASARLEADLARAQHDAKHFEVEHRILESKFKFAEERAEFWKAEAERARPSVMAPAAFTPVAAVDEAGEPDEPQAEVPEGFWRRFNEIHNDGWRPPGDVVTASEEPTSGDE